MKKKPETTTVRLETRMLQHIKRQYEECETWTERIKAMMKAADVKQYMALSDVQPGTLPEYKDKKSGLNYEEIEQIIERVVVKHKIDATMIAEEVTEKLINSRVLQ